MYSQYIIFIDKHLISETVTFLSLSRGDLKAETISQIKAAQDQALRTKYFIKNIANTNSKGRLCQNFYEAIQHFISACPILSKEKYVKRRDRVHFQLHMQGNMGKLQNEHWYEHVPKSVEMIHDCSIIDSTSAKGKNSP